MLPGSSTLDPDSDLREFGSKNVKEKKNLPRFFKQKYLLKHQAESRMTNCLRDERRHSRSITVALEYVFKGRVSALKLRLSCHVALGLVSPKSSLNAADHGAQKLDQEMTSQPGRDGVAE